MSKRLLIGEELNLVTVNVIIRMSRILKTVHELKATLANEEEKMVMWKEEWVKEWEINLWVDPKVTN